jgi:FAD/FMN-containing dehydrogenase
VPVTTRGAGTGNYGQAMPMRGGCVMHLKHMNKVKEIASGPRDLRAGDLLKDLDAACRAHSGRNCACSPRPGPRPPSAASSRAARAGRLLHLGGAARFRQHHPPARGDDGGRAARAGVPTGEELARVSHAYGTNGIITEIEMPLAPAYDWVEMFVAFDDFMEAARFAEDVANEDGILIKLATVFEAPIGHDYFQRVKPACRGGHDTLSG